MMKYLLVQVIAIFGSTTACWSCDSELPKLRQDMPYKEARELLLDEGWQGINYWILGPEKDSPIEYVWAGLGFKEVRECAGIGPSSCSFEFRNSKDEKLVITTYFGQTLKLEHWSVTKN